jgi:FtsH-binding integral membrane protein
MEARLDKLPMDSLQKVYLLEQHLLLVFSLFCHLLCIQHSRSNHMDSTHLLYLVVLLAVLLVLDLETNPYSPS